MKEDKPGKLILVPALLGGEDPKDVIPDHALDIIRDLTCFITENAKTARAMMKKFGMKNNFDNI